jgi:exonuclease VII large subunit
MKRQTKGPIVPAILAGMILLCPMMFGEASCPVVAAPEPAGLSVPEAQQNNKDRDPLTPSESDQIAEVRDQPVARIKLYQKYIQQRIDAIKDLGASPKAEDRKAELRARYEEFTRLSDELQDNLDTFDEAHADIRKALKELVPATQKWPDILKVAAPDPTYDFSRKTALDAAESTSDQAKKLYDEQLKYFAEHKDEAGKNGTGPS